MSLERLLLAVGGATILAVGIVPVANAAQVDADTVCIERHQGPGPQHRLRDTVERPVVDRLQGWIERHRKLADRAALAAAGDEIVTIRTWIHVIRATNTIAGGNIPARGSTIRSAC